MIRAQPSPLFGSWPSAKRPRDLGFCASAPGAVAPPTRRVSQQRDSATPRQGACAHTARSTDLQFVPVPHLPRCCSARAFRSSAELASAIRQKGSLRGDPRSSPALRSRSLAVRALLRGLRLLRARLPREVPGFGAVLIARSARVTDRGARLPRISARCPSRRPVRDSRRPRSLLAAKRWIAVTSSVVCSIVKGSSPHSVPNRLDPEASRFRLSPHSVPLEFLAVPRGAASAPRNSDSCRGHVRGGRNWVGTRRELGGNHRGLASPPARPRAWRCHASTATTSPRGSPVPIASITHTKARDGFLP